MAIMDPLLRLSEAFRAGGMTPEQATEAADAVEEHSYGRRESDLKFERLIAEMHKDMAELRRDMERMRNQILFGVLAIAGVVLAIVEFIN